MKQVFICLLSILIISCGANKDSKSDQEITGRVDTISSPNWSSFWQEFTSAASKRDTSTIVALTNFPFSQNKSETDPDRFRSLWVSQVFELSASDSAASLTGSDFLDRTEDHIHIDSVRYIHKNGRDYYFAQVNGFYRLIEIVTPG